MKKLYKIKNAFIDIHTKEQHLTTDEPKEFTEERVKEINNAEILLGYKLIEEVKNEETEIVNETVEDRTKNKKK